MLEDLKQIVWQTNMDLVKYGLVIFTWGNVSGIDRDKGLVAIKPSGLAYEDMTPEDICIVDMNGKLVEGKFRPSSDTGTHLEIYKAFEGKIKGIFDPSNFIQCGQQIIPTYEMLRDYIDYFHVKDCLFEGGKVRPAGLGDGHIVELLEMFAKEKDGEHFLTLEPHLKVFDGLSALENEGGTADQLKDDYTYPTNRAAFDAAADALDACLEKAGLNGVTVRG